MDGTCLRQHSPQQQPECFEPKAFPGLIIYLPLIRLLRSSRAMFQRLHPSVYYLYPKTASFSLVLNLILKSLTTKLVFRQANGFPPSLSLSLSFEVGGEYRIRAKRYWQSVKSVLTSALVKKPGLFVNCWANFIVSCDSSGRVC